MTSRVHPTLNLPEHLPVGGRRLTLLQRCVVAALLAMLALAAQALLRGHVDSAYYPVYLASVAVSAWLGGLIPGILTAAVVTAGTFLSARGLAAGDWLMSVLSGGGVAWLVAFLLAARRRAERSAARAGRMHALNQALGPALAPREVAHAVVGHAVEALQAAGGGVVLAGQTGLLHGEGSLEQRTRSPLVDEVLQDGLPRFESTADGSLAVLPLLTSTRPLGVLELDFSYRRRFGRDDRVYMLALAGQGARALERSLLYDAERAARRNAEEAGERLAFLARASEVLGSSLDYKATLATVARLAVPHLADWCAVDVIDDGRLRRLAIAHTDPARVDEVWEMSRRYAELPADPVPHAIASGQPQLVPVIPDQLLRAFARDSDHLERLRVFGLRSLLIVPLRARSRVLGAITFVMAESGRQYSEADLPLAEDLARRAALAVDNARLYQEAEGALHARKESLALLDTVFGAAPVGLAFVDREARFVRLNDALAALAGGGELLGRTPAEALGQAGEWLETSFRQVLASGAPVLDREIRTSHDGRELIALASFYPVSGRGGGVELVGAVVLDVTERRRADELVMQSQRMEAVAKVAGGVAHEVNNMMTVINGFTGFLHESFEPNDARIADVAEIRKAADRAAGITRQLLAYSRQQVMQPRALHLGRLLQGSLPVLQRLVGQGIRVRSQVHSAVPLVRADPAQLEQVLVNLALNAKDAMPAGGELAIEVEPSMLTEQAAEPGRPAVPAGRYARIAVRDSGHGMDAETRARAFEPFFTTKRPGEGTGLGLATVYGIVKQSDGFIWCYSEPERGTTFEIFLPERLGLAPTPLSRPAAPAPQGGGETVLVVEDEEPVRRMAARTLSSRGYHVLEAGDGVQALAREPEWGVIDLLVTDVVMPGMGGRELAAALLARRPGLKLLYMSGYTDDEVTRRGLLDAGAPFLEKPFEAEGLARRVREVLMTPSG
ncbi:MAG TPA: ATP-binding protein [Gemmatimonadales bacterium]|nr:ATP-binding protein [Gemmatimonadales bacterium]